MERMICLAIGYVFGLFQTGYIYGKLKHMDIREFGSGNAGTTNAIRVLGKKAGVITYIGDTFKAIFAILLISALYRDCSSEVLFLLKMYCGLGVVLGHNFPFYMGFKGGKGIAATSGVIVGMGDIKLILLAFVTFTIVALVSKYVSLGSLCMLGGFFAEVLIFNHLGMIGFENDLGLRGQIRIELYILAFIFTFLAFYKHKANIKRLIDGNERKIGQKKEA